MLESEAQHSVTATHARGQHVSVDDPIYYNFKHDSPHARECHANFVGKKEFCEGEVL
jgi:hypothetical protein